jgi:hypothetical protein
MVEQTQRPTSSRNFSTKTTTPCRHLVHTALRLTKDDHDVLIYDRYAFGKFRRMEATKNLTDGAGRKRRPHCYVRLDPKERSIDPDKPLLLQAENEDTRDTGFFRDKVNSTLAPQNC